VEFGYLPADTQRAGGGGGREGERDSTRRTFCLFFSATATMRRASCRRCSRVMCLTWWKAKGRGGVREKWVGWWEGGRE